MIQFPSLNNCFSAVHRNRVFFMLPSPSFVFTVIVLHNKSVFVVQSVVHVNQYSVCN